MLANFAELQLSTFLVLQPYVLVWLQTLVRTSMGTLWTLPSLWLSTLSTILC